MYIAAGRKTSTVVIALFLFPLLMSCHGHRIKKSTFINTSDAEQFGDKLQGILKPVDTSRGGSRLQTTDERMRYVYQVTDYQSVWMVNNRPGKAATTFLQELEDVAWDGLDPERYHLSDLKKLTDAVSAGKDRTNIDSTMILDTMLTASYLAVTHDLLFGEIVPVTADSLWHHKNDSTYGGLQALVHNDEKYVPLSDYRSNVPTYALLREAYKHYNDLGKDQNFNNAIKQVQDAGASAHDSATVNAVNYIMQSEVPWTDVEHSDTISDEAQRMKWYQSYMGLKMTGKMDSATAHRLTTDPQQMIQKLKANMERVRWMQKDMGDLYVVVDVPMMEFFLRKDGQTVMHMRTVVGKPERQTPALDANMANVVINPPWGVPPTILKQDVLPGITKSGASYLAKKGLKVYDHQGKVIRSNSVNSKNYKNYVYKQDPGDDNALGYVKFNLPNKWDIYLHDTPHRGDFVKYYRALSSGCIRLQQPQELAIYILSQLEKKRYDQGRLDSVIETHKTRWEVLKNKIPVHIVYLTNFEDTTGKHLRFVNDVYNRDERLISLLK